jgi:hypothetical protein
MNRLVYFNSKFETLALSKGTTVIISGIDNFYTVKYIKVPFALSSTLINKQIQSIFDLSTELTQASSSETLASQVEEGEGA